MRRINDRVVFTASVHGNERTKKLLRMVSHLCAATDLLLIVRVTIDYETVYRLCMYWLLDTWYLPVDSETSDIKCCAYAMLMYFVH